MSMSMSMSKTVSHRIEDIEVLRAIAVIFTILTHINGLLPWYADRFAVKNVFFNFSTGVDLFFAVSGFVIARDLLPRIAAASTRENLFRVLVAFWIRRIYRIWPTSWIWIIAIVACSIIFKEHFAPLNVALADLQAIAMQVANFHWWWCVNGHASECGTTAGVWWSLSLEEQFYIILPFAALIFRNRLSYFLLVVVLAQAFMPRPNWNTTLLWWIRTDAISLGVLIAIFSRSNEYKIIRPDFLSKKHVALIIFGMLVFLLATVQGLPTKIDPVPFSTGLIALISATLVLIASYNGNYLARGWIFKPVMLWIGSRSFAIYLIHSFAFNLTALFWIKIEPEGTVFGPSYNLRFILVWAILAFGLAELNYRFVETPMRKKGRKLSEAMERRTITGLAAGIASQERSYAQPNEA